MGIGMTPMLGLDTDHDGESLTAHGLYCFRVNQDIGVLIANAPVAERLGGEPGSKPGQQRSPASPARKPLGIPPNAPTGHSEQAGRHACRNARSVSLFKKSVTGRHERPPKIVAISTILGLTHQLR